MDSTSGIILRTIPYQDSARILTVFSKTSGLMSFFIKGLSPKKSHLTSLTEPFNEVEIHYKKGRTDLHLITDLSSIHSHPDLRLRLSSLQAAGKLLHAVLSSQLPGKPAESLYRLLSLYLKNIPHFDNPHILTTSFYLKLLKHEGSLSLSASCSSCEQTNARFLHEGESFCPAHAPKTAHPFSKEDWTLLHLLTHAQTFDLLKTLPLPSHVSTFAETYLKKLIGIL